MKPKGGVGGKNQPIEITEKEMLMAKITHNKTKQNEAAKDSDYIDLRRLLTMWNCNYLLGSWDLAQGIITTKLRRLFSGAEHIDFAVLQHSAKQLTMSFKCSLTKHINKHKTFKKSKNHLINNYKGVNYYLGASVIDVIINKPQNIFCPKLKNV